MSIRPYTNKKGERIRGRFIIDYYPQGAKGKRERRVYDGTEGEAHVYEKELRQQNIDRPNYINPKIADILPDYLSWLKLHRAPRTYEDIKKSLKWMLPHFGNIQFSRITPSIIDQYKQKRAGRPRATNKELAYLQSIIKYAVKTGAAQPLPFRIEKLPYKRTIPKIPHPLEIEKLIAAVQKDKERKQALLLFMWECGLRFGDASRIKWEDIDWYNGSVNLVQKGGGERVAVMTDRIKHLLEPIKKDDGYVFLNKLTGKPWQSLKCLFTEASKRAGIKRFNPHALRHAAATYLLEATDNLRLVQHFLGHKDITTTQIYTRVTAIRLKEGMARAADYIGRLKNEQTVDIKKGK